MRTGVIYIWRNLETGKKYIGQTLNFDRRIYTEWWISKRKNKEGFWIDNTYFSKSLRKYPHKEQWKIEILVKDIDEDKLDYFESFFIKQFNSFVPNGYNSTSGGDRGIQQPHTTEWKNSHSQRMSGKNNPMYGRELSCGEKEKLSKSQGSKKFYVIDILKGHIIWSGANKAECARYLNCTRKSIRNCLNDVNGKSPLNKNYNFIYGDF